MAEAARNRESQSLRDGEVFELLNFDHERSEIV